MRVKAAVDGWISILIWGVIIILIACNFYIPGEERLIGGIASVLVIAFLLSLYFYTFYEMRKTYLYCRSGPFFEKINYDRIKSLRLCVNLSSSMALSMKRIEIKQHGKGFITGTTYISPVNREEFFKELKCYCKNLEE